MERIQEQEEIEQTKERLFNLIVETRAILRRVMINSKDKLKTLTRIENKIHLINDEKGLNTLENSINEIMGSLEVYFK